MATPLNAKPQQRRANRAVARAIEMGVLVRPDSCEVCGKSDRKIYAHHPDYTERLRVEWLCARCHHLTH